MELWRGWLSFDLDLGLGKCSLGRLEFMECLEVSFLVENWAGIIGMELGKQRL